MGGRPETAVLDHEHENGYGHGHDHNHDGNSLERPLGAFTKNVMLIGITDASENLGVWWDGG